MKFGLELPSTCIPYNVKHVDMDIFGMPQIKLLSKAVALDSMEPSIEALNGVLSVDARTLTDGDYSYLMAHQRLVGYKDSAIVAPWTCNHTMLRELSGLKRLFTKEQIVDLVESYHAASEEEQKDMQNPQTLNVTNEDCGHYNSFDITMPDLTIFQLLKEPIDERLDYPRVATLADGLRMREDPERYNLVDAARWIKDGDDLEEKFALLEEGGIELLQVALKTNITHAHGVGKYVTKLCEKCGTPHNTIFNITPDLFFRV